MSRSIITLVLLTVNYQINAEISEKQYASMPELFYEDNYDNCMLRVDEAFYCSIKFILEPLNPENTSDTWNYIKNISSIESNYRHDHLRHFICVPKTCPKALKSKENDPLLRKALERCFNEKIEDLQLKGTISEMICQTGDSKYPVDGLDILCGVLYDLSNPHYRIIRIKNKTWDDIAKLLDIKGLEGSILFITYLSFVLYATFYESVPSYKIAEGSKKLTTTIRHNILSAFSLRRNWYRLKTITSTPKLEKLRGIQGIRFYNSALVVLSHTLIAFFGLPIANTRFAETIHENPLSILFGCAHLCMTTFFFISSFLLSIDVFEFLKDKKDMSFTTALWIFACRLVRQVPPLAVIILFHATWLRHLGSGPHWEAFIIAEYKYCRKNWWANLLFINNLVDPENMCLQPSWWLALSTQYVALSILFIWALKTYENHIWLIIGSALTFSIFGTFLENYYQDFPSLLLYQPEPWYDLKTTLASPQVTNQLRGFIGNLAGPLIGIGFGYYFNQCLNDSSKGKLFNTKLRVFIWWILIGLGIGCVVAPGLVLFLYSNEHNAFWASVYMSLSRPLFSLFLGSLLIGFTEGVGWICLYICQWSPTYILGRLTYSVYLVHLCIILVKSASSRFPVYMSEFVAVTEFCGNMVVVYIAATFLTLFVELPVSALQKIISNPARANQEGEENALKNE